MLRHLRASILLAILIAGLLCAACADSSRSGVRASAGGQWSFGIGTSGKL